MKSKEFCYGSCQEEGYTEKESVEPGGSAGGRSLCLRWAADGTLGQSVELELLHILHL